MIVVLTPKQKAYLDELLLVQGEQVGDGITFRKDLTIPQELDLIKSIKDSLGKDR